MNKNVIRLIKLIVPISVRIEWQRFFDKEKYMQSKKKYIETKQTIDFLKTELKKNEDVEKRQVLEFLKKKGGRVFLPYDFIYKYDRKNIEVHLDVDCKMNYVLYGNKRLYFPFNMEVEKVKTIYSWLLMEQDINSPHCYQTEKFQVRRDSIVADVGAAEGLFSLMIIDKVKEIHLFECEQIWIEALEKTFEPWKEKVKIINKYVSDISNETNVTLDEYFEEKEVNFIKADIEGAELSMLKGAVEILQRKNLKLVLCTYHKRNDAEGLSEELTKNGFVWEFSKGYVLIDFIPPYLRRGLIRAIK